MNDNHRRDTGSSSPSRRDTGVGNDSTTQIAKAIVLGIVIAAGVLFALYVGLEILFQRIIE